MQRTRFARRLLFAVAVLGLALVAWRLWPPSGSVSGADPGVRAEAPPARPGGSAGPSGSVAAPGRRERAPVSPDSAVLGLPLGPLRRPSPDDCDDGDPCTRRDTLTGGECRGEPFECDDGNPLTIDECTGAGCLFRPAPGVTRPEIR